MKYYNRTGKYKVKINHETIHSLPMEYPEELNGQIIQFIEKNGNY